MPLQTQISLETEETEYIFHWNFLLPAETQDKLCWKKKVKKQGAWNSHSEALHKKVKADIWWILLNFSNLDVGPIRSSA